MYLINFCWNTHRNKSKWSSSCVLRSCEHGFYFILFCKCVLRSEVAAGCMSWTWNGSEINFIFTENYKFHNQSLPSSSSPEHDRVFLLLCLRKTCTKWRFITWYAHTALHFRDINYECMQQSISCRIVERNEQNRAANSHMEKSSVLQLL